MELSVAYAHTEASGRNLVESGEGDCALVSGRGVVAAVAPCPVAGLCALGVEDKAGCAVGDSGCAGVGPLVDIVAEVGHGRAGPFAAEFHAVMPGVGLHAAPAVVGLEEYGLLTFGNGGLGGVGGLGDIAAAGAVGFLGPGFGRHCLVGPFGPGLVNGFCREDIFAVLADFAGSRSLVGVEHIYADVAFAGAVGGESAVGHGLDIAGHGIDVAAVEHSGECGAAGDGDQHVGVGLAVGVAAFEGHFAGAAFVAVLPFAEGGHGGADFVETLNVARQGVGEG